MVCRETAKEIASALAYLHSLNILHGDLSGGNILLTSSNKDPRKFTCKVGRHDMQTALHSSQVCTYQPLCLHMPPLESDDVDNHVPTWPRPCRWQTLG